MQSGKRSDRLIRSPRAVDLAYRALTKILIQRWRQNYV